MKTTVEDFSKITCILRGFTATETNLVLNVLRDSAIRSVEITMNTEGALEIIKKAVADFGSSLCIGAGTVTTMEQLEAVTEAGVDFVLSPIMFSKEMLEYCHARNVIAVPAAFTPSEIFTQLAWGADIVKVFPASVAGPEYFRQLAGPLGHLPLMAVGGVNAANAVEFMESGCDYLGIGSGMFDKADVAAADEARLRESIKNFERVLRPLLEGKEEGK